MITQCEQLDLLITENFSYDEVNRLRVTMETPMGAMNVMQNAFNTIVEPIQRFVQSLLERTKLEKSIENSKGDITKIPEMNSTLQILDMLSKSNDKEISDRAKNIQAVYSGIKRNKISFMKAYQIKGDSISGKMVWIMYIVYTKSVVNATSHLIMLQSGQINHETTLLKEMGHAADLCNNGDTKKYCDFFLKKKVQSTKETFEPANESVAIVVTVALLAAVVSVAFFLRVLVFYFYYVRTDISDYFTQQADYLKMHAAEVKSNKSIDTHEKQAILNAQKTWADRFMRLSDAFAVDDVQASKKAQDSVKQLNKEVKSNNIDIPNTGMEFL